MTRLLQVVDDVVAASLRERDRASAETATIKEASAQPRSPLARELCAIATSLRDENDDVSYADLGGAR